MKKFRLYLEISANARFAVDQNDQPCSCGVSFGFSIPDDMNLDYLETANKFNLDKIAEDFLFGMCKGDDLKVISPEEYADKYGEDEDDDAR